MAYRVVCKACGNEARIKQQSGLRMSSFRCQCGGQLRRVGWQELYRRSGRAPETAAHVAAKHLRATGNQSVGWGDSGLLHQIASLLGMPHEGPTTEAKVLDRIDRSHIGVLEKRYGSYPSRGLGRVRQFWLPTDGTT